MFRYLIVTSILRATILFPLFWWAAKYLFAMRGLVSLNNANAGRFLLSVPGALFILLALTSGATPTPLISPSSAAFSVP